MPTFDFTPPSQQPAAPQFNFSSAPPKKLTPAQKGQEVADVYQIDTSKTVPKTISDIVAAEPEAAAPKLNFGDAPAQPVPPAAPVPATLAAKAGDPELDPTKHSTPYRAVAALGKSARGVVNDVAGSAVDALKLPGDVTAGKYKKPWEDNNPELQDRTLNLAAAIAGGDSFAKPLAKKVGEEFIDSTGRSFKGEAGYKEMSGNVDAAGNHTPAASAAPGLAKSIQFIFSPTSAGPGAKSMEQTIRESTGTANRSIAEGEATLAKSAKDVANMTLEDTMKFYDHVENVSKPETDIPLNPKIRAFADDTRSIMQGMRKRLESMPDGDKMGFYQDYFPHYWENPEKARAFTNDFVAKQGSSAATKARTYPTISDGLKAGLKLADPNPVRAASRYVTSTNNYIAAKDVVEQAVRKGDAAYYPQGRQPEGWVPLTGRFAEKGGAKLYAPPDAARIYNNFYSKGIEATQAATPYEALRTATAENTAAELALSAYHAMTITAQNMFNDVARVMKNAAVGDWEGIGKALKSATAGQLPGIKGGNYEVGSKFMEQYKGLEDHGIDMESVVDHFTKAGGKVGQDKLYRTRPEGGFINAWKQGQLGTVGKELKDTALSSPAGALKATYQTLGRVAEDVVYPLFEHYIPRIKTGAFGNMMSDWIRQNPTATEKEIAAARIRIMDQVDDRFGEMNMDNIFWAKTQKQMASVLLRAQGWDIGLARQSGGAITDVVKSIKDIATGTPYNKQLLDRPLFVTAAAMTTMLMNSAYQYLKTGEAPQDMQDMILPRTGGKTPQGKPERVMLPGHGREMIQAMTPEPGEAPYSGLVSEAGNKIAAFPKHIYEALANEDNLGLPLGGPLDRIGHVAEGFVPFSIGDSNAPKKHSNLGFVERRVAGMRPAGMRFTDPERAANKHRKYDVKPKEKAKKKMDRKQKAQIQK